MIEGSLPSQMGFVGRKKSCALRKEWTHYLLEIRYLDMQIAVPLSKPFELFQKKISRPDTVSVITLSTSHMLRAEFTRYIDDLQASTCLGLTNF